MRKRWFGLLMAAMLLLPANRCGVVQEVRGEAETINLLVNDSFEQHTNGTPASWTATGGWGGGQIALGAEAARTGDVGVVLETQTSGSPYIRQKVLVEEGATYESKAWVKFNDLTGQGVITKVEFYTATGGWVSGHESDKFKKLTSDWQQIQFEIEAPPGSSFAYVYYRLYHATGKAYLDDASFVKLHDKRQLTLQTDQLFYYSDAAQGHIQAVIEPKDGVIANKQVEWRLVHAGTNQVIASGSGLAAEPQMSIPFDPQIMANEQAYRIEMVLKQGNVIVEQQQRDIYRWDRPAALRADGTLLVDGQPFFPVIGYHVLEADYPVVSASINTVQGWLTNDDNRMKSYLDQAEANGLKVLVPLYTGMKVKENMAHTERKVNKFKDHPAVLGWIVMDEPTNNGIPYEELIDAYKLIRTLDRVHPTFIVEANAAFYKQTGQMADVLGIDPYPLPNNNVTMVGARTVMAKEAVGYEKPVWAILQAYRKSTENYIPTADELRQMAYHAILNGAQGIGYYAFSDPNWNLMTQPLYAGAVALKANELPALETYAMERQLLQQTNTSSSHWAMWTAGDGTIYAAAANHTSLDQQVTIELPAAGYEAVVLASQAPQTVSIAGSQLHIPLSKWETALIQLRAPAVADLPAIRQAIDRYVEQGEMQLAFANDLQARLHMIAVMHEQGYGNEAVAHMRDLITRINDASVLQQQLLAGEASAALTAQAEQWIAGQ